MSWNVAIYIGAGLLALSGYLAAREHLWLSKSEIVPGTVIGLKVSRGSKGSSYAPEVRFVARDGSMHEFTRGYYSDPVGFRVGDSIFVAYDPRSYEGRILTFGQRFGFPVIVAAIGLGLTAMGGAFILGRTVVPSVYLQQQGRATGVETDRRSF